ncbi:hypothetical protein H9L10_12690 [Phycicoccus endophyticus]|uniref:Uncharacterized protein n=1 Tax=Phycicoccus endophyticus TaxID=1690220 RepID=A0A7G9R0F7_9MICO|nr:hypothetical protein [Phycicoccus endophyticus]NHI20102.1 hypothetical protein [Phycicoccus endophyticus]QNN49082.1 hypothetical protein H9L10_12690 [Phycicoccus endophyticus]GGL38441.1 hypothetical protein GCM10012283_21230 [Phycicoccus endophyticus]
MNAATLSVQKARALAANLRAAHAPDRGYDGRVDHDLVRAAQEARTLAQASAPRII